MCPYVVATPKNKIGVINLNDYFHLFAKDDNHHKRILHVVTFLLLIDHMLSILL